MSGLLNFRGAPASIAIAQFAGGSQHPVASIVEKRCRASSTNEGPHGARRTPDSGGTLLPSTRNSCAERTYRAELCLIQVATLDRAACVDPLRLPELSTLARPLTLGTAVQGHARLPAGTSKYFIPWPVWWVRVFDTQIAASLTGAPAQVGYADPRTAGSSDGDLAKAHTRTDWSVPPIVTGADRVCA